MKEERLTIDVTAYTDNPDLLHELFRAILGEGISQYHQYGDLEPFERLSIHVTTPHHERYKLLSYEAAPEPDAPTTQLTMPGL